MKTNNDMYGQVYEMDCNGYHYVGVHNGDIFDDGYFGSGIAWTNVVRKYGKDAINRRVIRTYNSKVEKDSLEKQYIAQCKNKYDKKCLNIADGGEGGNLGEEVNRKISKAVSGKKNGMYGKKLSDKSKKLISKKLSGHPNYNQKGYTHTEDAKKRISEKHIGMKHTEESIEKIRKARREQKNVNTMGTIGKHWYHNLRTNEERMMFSEQTTNEWKLGRISQPTKGLIYCTNGEADILVEPFNIPVGYYAGRHAKQEYTEERNNKISQKLKGRRFSKSTRDKISKSLTGRRWWTNGEKEIQSYECPIGWKKGRVKHEKTNC